MLSKTLSLTIASAIKGQQLVKISNFWFSANGKGSLLNSLICCSFIGGYVPDNFMAQSSGLLIVTPPGQGIVNHNLLFLHFDADDDEMKYNVLIREL